MGDADWLESPKSDGTIPSDVAWVAARGASGRVVGWRRLHSAAVARAGIRRCLILDVPVGPRRFGGNSHHEQHRTS
ncbi:Transcription Factor Nf-E4 [Manis pentadactyla]|nr:Transcription Factor Nf-E4 [Manis pentadactyla]